MEWVEGRRRVGGRMKGVEKGKEWVEGWKGWRGEGELRERWEGWRG